MLLEHLFVCARVNIRSGIVNSNEEWDAQKLEMREIIGAGANEARSIKINNMTSSGCA